MNILTSLSDTPSVAELARYHTLLRKYEDLSRLVLAPFEIFGMLPFAFLYYMIEENSSKNTISFFGLGKGARVIESARWILWIIFSVILYQILNVSFKNAPLYFFKKLFLLKAHSNLLTVRNKLYDSIELKKIIEELSVENRRMEIFVKICIYLMSLCNIYVIFLRKTQYRAVWDSLTLSTNLCMIYNRDDIERSLYFFGVTRALKKLIDLFEKHTFLTGWETSHEKTLHYNLLYLDLQNNMNEKGEMTLDLGDKISVVVRAQDYLCELQRIFIEYGFPILSCSHKQIFVGYSGMNKRTAQRFGIAFRKALMAASVVYDAKLKMEEELEKINTRLDVGSPWELYEMIKENGSFSYYFSLDISGIEQAIQNRIFAIVRTLYSNSNVVVTRSYIVVNESLPAGQKLFQKAFRKDQGGIAAAKRRLLQPACRSIPSLPEESSMPEVARKRVVVKEMPPSESTTLPANVPQSLPELHWPGGVFFRPFTGSSVQDQHQLQRAYPFPVPWLKHAFGMIDERVLAAAAPYVEASKQISREEKIKKTGESIILDTLKRGRILPSKGSKRIKSKEGHVGIKSDGRPFKDIDGNDRCSSFKIKIGNIRIFAPPIQPVDRITVDGETFSLYRFVGVGQGHIG